MTGDYSEKLVADKYRVGDLVREGELGDLYTGRHEVMDRPVAIKILPQALAVDQRWSKRFIDEAWTASMVSHPNILNVTDFGTDGKGVSYSVYDNFDGRMLRDFVPDGPATDAREALHFTGQIANAVAAGHAKKVIHGRLSPENIFVNSEAETYTAKAYGLGADPLTVDRSAAPQYLPPEQLSAFPAADERSDVYSLGVILFELLTGVVPFDGATAADIAAKRSTEPPPPLSAFNRDFHPEIEPILLTAIAADPDKRYQTMAAFAEDIEVLAGRVGGNTEAAAAATGRNVWKTATIALAGIIVLAVALIYATSVRQTDATEIVQAEAGSLPVQPIGPATGAQEESLAKLPVQTEAEILAQASMANAMMMSDLPGGDGYNAWANGGAPPPGAPLAGAPLQPQYFPPGGQVYSIDPNGGSQFMPNESGVILVPVPANTNTAAKPETAPKTSPANNAAQPKPEAASTPKPMATPPPKAPAANTQPKKNQPAKPATSTKPGESDLEVY